MSTHCSWLAAVLLILSAALNFGRERGPACAGEEGAPQAHSQSLARLFGKFYQPVTVDVKPAVPPYALPVTGDLPNYAMVTSTLGLGPGLTDQRKRTPEETARWEALHKNGFFVRPWRGEDFAKAYSALGKMDVPVFITSDSVLHLYHINFDETLAEIENTSFALDLAALLQSVNTYLTRQYKVEPASEDLKAATALLYSALELAGDCLTRDPNASRGDGDRKGWFAHRTADVDKEFGLIQAHAGFAASPLFGYQEDYSQYVPRGHYTRSETLKRYFRAMMYLGRMTFLLKGGEPHGTNAPYLVSAQEARRQTLAAALLAEVLATARLTDGRMAREVWERIYAVTAFYVGLSDDLTCGEYLAALKAAGAASVEQLAGDEKLFNRFRARVALLRKPAIFSGTGNPLATGSAALMGDPSPEELDKALDKTQGLRVMGQRFVPDSYWMGRLVFPGVGAPLAGRADAFTCGSTGAGPGRVFPRGLDVMALLGSARAAAVLKASGDDAYAGYAQRREELEKELQPLAAGDWNANAYWAWLFGLKPLLQPCGAGYPTFMHSEAWQDKQLNAALGSWAQLRHDTILYVKQSYTMVGSAAPRPPKDLPGYVEPVPEFYARVLALARMTRAALTDLKALSPAGKERLERSEKVIERLLDISVRELRNEALTADDEQYIKRIGGTLEYAVRGPAQPVGGMTGRAAQTLETEVRTTLVADVHTDGNSQQVLEEATGYLDLLVAVAPEPDGKLRICAGPVFSQYEFKQPLKDRLTDEAWRARLPKDPPARGPWTKTYLVSP